MARRSPLLIRGGRLVDPASLHDGPADLLIENGRIAARGEGLTAPPEAEIIDARELVVCPGFIDLHTHLRFPGFPDKETIASGTAAAAAGGFTTVCAMANTDPVVDRVAVLKHVLGEVEREGSVRALQLASVTAGLEGKCLADLAALAAAGAVAFSDDGKPVADAAVMRRALRASDELGKVVSVHEEDPVLVGAGVANAGERARRLGLAGWPCSGEASLVARDLSLLEEAGGRLHIAHVSCAETVDLLRAAKGRGLPVTAEATPHHLLLTDALLDGDAGLGLTAAHPCTKVNPPLRSDRDREALVDAVADGTIEAVATDHAPHTQRDKAFPYDRAAFGFSGIELALPLLLELARRKRLSLATIVERLTTGPARIFGLEGGTLVQGAAADVTIFDPDAQWTVNAEALQSKGKNTPLLGAELRGRVLCTLVGGEIAHREGISPRFRRM